MQTCLTGAAARSIVDPFAERWKLATGTPRDKGRLVAPGPSALETAVSVPLPMPEARVVLSRTIPLGIGRETAVEVKDLSVRAIEHAERLVYIETRYLTSAAVQTALTDRMRDTGRSTLDVVVMLLHKPEKVIDEFTVSIPQASVLWQLRKCAREMGHRFGVYEVAAPGPSGEDMHVYIHSKLMVVDDRFLTVGSNKLTN